MTDADILQIILDLVAEHQVGQNVNEIVTPNEDSVLLDEIENWSSIVWVTTLAEIGCEVEERLDVDINEQLNKRFPKICQAKLQDIPKLIQEAIKHGERTAS